MILPIQFYTSYGLYFTDLELDRDLNDNWVDAFEYDLETLRGEVKRMREDAETEGELDELRAMLEYVAGAKTSDVPFNLGVCGLWFVAASLFDEELNHLATWARSVNFPELEPMTDEEKREAVKRVEITDVTLDEWRKKRRAGGG